MQTNLLIHCVNNGRDYNVPFGSTVAEAYRAAGLSLPYGPVCALVNNRVRGLDFQLAHNKDIEFLSLDSPEGVRTYTRSVVFVLYKALLRLHPTAKMQVEAPVSNGYYCSVDLGRKLTEADVAALEQGMRQIVEADLPLEHVTVHTEQAVALFRGEGLTKKARLLSGLGSLYSDYYTLDGTADYYYGALLPSTGRIGLFALTPYSDGVLLRVPTAEQPDVLPPIEKQEKMLSVFREHHEWQRLLGVSTVGDLNYAAEKGLTNQLVNVSEALQEKKISRMADAIAARPEVRVVLISGPSSSGKTTFSKRLAVQLMACGRRPLPLSLDDYFVDRELTPRDASGDYDFESLRALNLPLIEQQIAALIRGDEVELPRYNFQTGHSEKSGHRLRIGRDTILVIEGIHALNPELLAALPEEQKYRIYVSALTSLLLDDHNYIPTSDNRLLRRIVRDFKYRGYSATETIRRWPSVRRGEEKWIFPYQERADAMFNSALLFELAVLRDQALPVLRRVSERDAEFAQAHRLIHFLLYLKPMSLEGLPPTSLLREFLGGSTFHY